MRRKALHRGARRAGAATLFVALASAALFASWLAASTAAPLRNTFPSPEAAARAVVEAMQAGDLDRARGLALSEEEFRVHVWPGLPASRPERNVPFDFVWDMLRQTSEGHLRQTAARIGQVPLAVQSVRFRGETSVYDTVTVYRDAELLVGAPDGTTRTVRLFGSMIEQDGAYKVFSYVVD